LLFALWLGWRVEGGGHPSFEKHHGEKVSIPSLRKLIHPIILLTIITRISNLLNSRACSYAYTRRISINSLFQSLQKANSGNRKTLNLCHRLKIESPICQTDMMTVKSATILASLRWILGYCTRSFLLTRGVNTRQTRIHIEFLFGYNCRLLLFLDLEESSELGDPPWHEAMIPEVSSS
jgi:hypothetical protein